MIDGKYYKYVYIYNIYVCDNITTCMYIYIHSNIDNQLYMTNDIFIVDVVSMSCCNSAKLASWIQDCSQKTFVRRPYSWKATIPKVRQKWVVEETTTNETLMVKKNLYVKKQKPAEMGF